jgi:hypothetical protein
MAGGYPTSFLKHFKNVIFVLKKAGEYPPSISKYYKNVIFG